MFYKPAVTDVISLNIFYCFDSYTRMGVIEPENNPLYDNKDLYLISLI